MALAEQQDRFDSWALAGKQWNISLFAKPRPMGLPEIETGRKAVSKIEVSSKCVCPR